MNEDLQKNIQEINKLPDCIIKPTNWDGSKFIFRNFKSHPLNAADIRSKLQLKGNRLRHTTILRSLKAQEKQTG